jgi:flagellar hook-length control protein FliK
MRISDVPPESDPSVNNADDANSQQTSEQDESSNFSKMLARKRAAGQEGNQPEGSLKPQSSSSSTNIDPTQIQPPGFQTSIQATAVESKHIVAIPPELQQLVREISTTVNSAGNHQVSIEMNSNVLKGLNIRIERGDAGVAIQFQSNSAQVSALLQNNMSSLSQGLADRGVRVSDIGVTAAGDQARTQDAKNRSYPGSQAGRQSRGR